MEIATSGTKRYTGAGVTAGNSLTTFGSLVAKLLVKVDNNGNPEPDCE